MIPRVCTLDEVLNSMMNLELYCGRCARGLQISGDAINSGEVGIAAKKEI